MDDRGQASVEVLAALPAILLAAAICLQLLAAGYSLTLADGAAEAGALAYAAGLPVEPAVVGSLPGWARERIEIDVEGGRVTIHLRPPAALPALAGALEVGSTAWVQRPAGGV